VADGSSVTTAPIAAAQFNTKATTKHRCGVMVCARVLKKKKMFMLWTVFTRIFDEITETGDEAGSIPP
jgi:hypothetical protein